MEKKSSRHGDKTKREAHHCVSRCIILKHYESLCEILAMPKESFKQIHL